MLSVDSSMSERSPTQLVKFLTADTTLQSAMQPGVQGRVHCHLTDFNWLKNMSMGILDRTASKKMKCGLSIVPRKYRP